MRNSDKCYHDIAGAPPCVQECVAAGWKAAADRRHAGSPDALGEVNLIYVWGLTTLVPPPHSCLEPMSEKCLGVTDTIELATLLVSNKNTS